MDKGSKHSCRSLMERSCSPLVFKNAVYKWPSLQWTPEFLSQVLGDKPLDCKISLVQCEEFQWEPDCLHLKITMKQYVDWLHGDTHQDNPLRLFDISKFSCYIDYKYMKDMFIEQPDMLKSVCWDVFGLNERDGEHSTIWIGSIGTYTPCHQDTYGFNLVAQIQGRKRWYLFNPDQTDSMYPTRLPYEESSVYSEVNVRYPDLARHPLFQKTTPYVIELVPGDVLYVPNHWWHFVESLEPSISINTWVPIVEDTVSQLDEAVCRLLYTCLSTTLLTETERLSYLNTGEELEDSTVNLQYIQKAVQTLVEHGDIDHPKSQVVNPSIKDNNTEGQRKYMTKLSCDNFEKFLNKVSGYTVTAVCLCGVEIDLSENHGSSVATKRKNFFYDESEIIEDIPDTRFEIQKSPKKIRTNILSSDIHKTASPADTGQNILESQSEVKNMQCKIELCTIVNEGRKIVSDKNNKSVTDESGPNRVGSEPASVTGQVKHCSIEIFAARCFTFNEYLRFLNIVFGYETNLKKTDCIESNVNGQIKPVSTSSASLSSSSSTYTLSASDLSQLSAPSSSATLLVSSPSPSSNTASTLPRRTPSVAESKFPGTQNTLSVHRNQLDTNTAENTDFNVEQESRVELTVSTADVINSILNPNVVRHIGQILMNKFYK